MTWKLVLAMLVVLSPGVVAQSSLANTFDGDNDWHRLAFSLCSAGDVNADGIPDVMVASAYGVYVNVYSGQDGSILGRVVP